jgi:cytoskeletal protein CcmA (bactofilin family)
MLTKKQNFQFFLNIKAKLQSKLPARALFFAIFVVLMVGLVSGALITLSHLQQTRLTYNRLEQEVIRNGNSGFQLLLAQETPTEQWIDLFGAGKDSVFIKKHSWGLFDIFYIKSTKNTLKKSFVHEKTALMGCEPNEVQQSALYLVDNFRPLSLAGNTKIEGTVYLPKAGVRRGSINGRSFSGKKLIGGERKRSKRSLPAIDKKRLVYIQGELLKISGIPQLKSITIQSFSDSSLEIFAPTVYLKNQTLQGNIIIRSDSLIYVGRNANLEDVLLFAPNIVFENGFRGSVQAYATNSILVQEGVQLRYPSTLGLLPNYISNTLQQGIFIKKEAFIEGFVFTELKKSRQPPILLKIEEGAEIVGEIYSSTKMDIRGNVKGHISTFGFIYQTPATIFDNHLMDVEIDYAKRPAIYKSPLFFNESKPNQIVKWIKK